MFNKNRSALNYFEFSIDCINRFIFFPKISNLSCNLVYIISSSSELVSNNFPDDR